MDDAKLVGEQTFVRTQALKFVRDLQGLTAILMDGECMTDSHLFVG